VQFGAGLFIPRLFRVPRNPAGGIWAPIAPAPGSGNSRPLRVLPTSPEMSKAFRGERLLGVFRPSGERAVSTATLGIFSLLTRNKLFCP